MALSKWRGATRQLFRFHEIRMPDLAFIITMFAIIVSIIASVVTNTFLWFIIPLLCLIGVSFLHTSRKFHLSLKQFFQSLGAVIIDALLILCYYFGRIFGMVVYFFHRLPTEKINSLSHTMTFIIIPTQPNLRYRPYIIANDIAAHGYKVHYVVWDDPFNMERKDLLRHFLTSFLPKKYQCEKITVHKFARLPYYWPYINGQLFRYQLKKLYKSLNADLVITETCTNETEVPKSLPFIYDLADDYAAPAELYGGLFYKMSFKLLDVKGVMRRQCKNALAVVAVSDKLIDFAKQYSEITFKLPNGVEKDLVEKALHWPRQTINPYSFIYVSAFAQWSRPVSAIKAVIELRDDFPGISLTLIGPGITNAESDKIKQYIKDNNVSQYVHYLGPIFDREKIFDHIGKNAIGLNISIKDKLRDAAQPVKVVEYSAMGKKIVSTDLAEVKSLKNFNNIFFFSDKLGPNLKTAMREALLHKGTPNEYRDVSKRVLRDYSWNAITDKLLIFTKNLGILL